MGAAESGDHALEEKIRKVNRKEELREHKEVQDAFDKHMELARIDDELFTAEIRNEKKTAREMQQRVEDRLTATLRRDRPYAAKINDAIMEKVRTTQRLTNQRSVSQRPYSTGRDKVDPLTMT